MKLFDRSRLTKEKVVLGAFIAIEACIYLVFNVLAFTVPRDPVYLKYSGILLCLAVTVVTLVFYRGDRDAVILTCALVFTAVSDLFILVMDKYYEVGLVTFIITQSLYFYRLYSGRLKKIWISAVVRAGVAAVILLVLGLTAGLNLLVTECAIYITMLAANCVDGWLLCKKSRQNLLFAIGITLFLCCDICVGLHNVGGVLGVELPKALLSAVRFLIWFFYLPSQVLITCSFRKGGLYQEEKLGEDVQV